MKIHIVQKGDTLWKLSKKYGVDFEKLKQANQQLSNPDLIMPGMKINIPGPGMTKQKEAAVKEKPVTKEKPVKKPEAVAPAPPPPAPMPPPQPKPKPKPSYHMQQAKMNVNIYKQPAKAPAPPPKKEVKPKPKPKPKPKEMVKPKPVTVPEKKKPMPKPKPKPAAKPKPKQPVWQPAGPVTEGCIPLAALCGCPPYGMWPQPYMPAMHAPHNHHHHMMPAPCCHPHHHGQHWQQQPMQGHYNNWRAHEFDAEDWETDYAENSRREYGDLTGEEGPYHNPYAYTPHNPYNAYYYGMVPWTNATAPQAYNDERDDDEE